MGAAASALGDPARLGGSVRGPDDQQALKLGLVSALLPVSFDQSADIHTDIALRGKRQGAKGSEQSLYHSTLNVGARLMC